MTDKQYIDELSLLKSLVDNNVSKGEDKVFSEMLKLGKKPGLIDADDFEMLFTGMKFKFDEKGKIVN